MAIDYDASQNSLFHPELHETVFKENGNYTPVQLGAEGARLAYYRAEESDEQRDRLKAALGKAGFSLVDLIHGPVTGSQAFIAHRNSDGLAMLAFRGTQADSVQDIGIDALALPVPWPAGGFVHAGFFAAFTELDRVLTPKLRLTPYRSLLICGHSLGGALALLAGTHHAPQHLVTIGAPRVGSSGFIDLLNGVPATRIVNCCDGVTVVPPGPLYRHPHDQLYLTRDGGLHKNPESEFIEADHVSAHDEFDRHYAGRDGNVVKRELSDHAPINYLRALFP